MKRKRYRRVRKSASWLEYDREIAEMESQAINELRAQVAPYPAYEDFQFPRQRGLNCFDQMLLEFIHREQRGENGCTLLDIEIASKACAPANFELTIKTLKRFRRRGLIVTTDNGNGIRVQLARLYRKVPVPDYWPNRRTWKAYVPA